MTRIGPVAVTESDGMIVSVRIVPAVYGGNATPTLEDAFRQLDEYLDGRRERFDLRYRLNGTNLQMKVWSALQEIPYGRTVSYKELAHMIGHDGSQRAVGNAVGKNPIPIFIPCHRVIRSDGGIGGYLYGENIKRALLRTEG